MQFYIILKVTHKLDLAVQSNAMRIGRIGIKE